MTFSIIGLRNVTKLINNIVKTETNDVKGEKWKQLPSMRLSRYHFPTIITHENKLAIVGGKCIPEELMNCKKIEVINTTSCEWGFDDQYLDGIRYNHNSAKISMASCANSSSCSNIKNGFVVGEQIC